MEPFVVLMVDIPTSQMRFSLTLASYTFFIFGRLVLIEIRCAMISETGGNRLGKIVVDTKQECATNTLEKSGVVTIIAII